jgi:hypothetical protein
MDGFIKRPDSGSGRRIYAEGRTVSRTTGRIAVACGCVVTVAASVALLAQAPKKELPPTYLDTPTGRWMVHDESRPRPAVVMPGVCGAQETPAKPPADAVVLFDGKDLSNWTDEKGGPSKWVARDGFMESVKGAGYIRSKQEFGSAQIHVEFATPSVVTGTGQGRGNSGVFVQGKYEVQVLDSYENPTYPDGQCGALYGRELPLVNASCKPGQWQTYDIVYHRPTFDANGKVTRKAVFTVIHNGIVIHDHVTLNGGTDYLGPHTVSDYSAIPDKGPLMFQDHNNPVRFRNIWVRELKD